MAQVSLHNLSKSFAGNIQALQPCTLHIEDGAFVVLVGPSGCGKSTLLRLIAGLEESTSGDIFIDGARMNGVPPKSRDIAMVFQNYALYPHMSVYKNLAFGLTMRSIPKNIIDERVREAASILGISDVLDRKPAALSGGQRQRVALGRALVRNPKVFLFDEPLSNLDAKLRVQMRTEIMRLHGRLKSTMVYVTHDQTEAMTMGDRIVVMHQGKILQDDTPLTIYQQPANRFVAEFIGSPAINFFPGTLEISGSALVFKSDHFLNNIHLPESAKGAFFSSASNSALLGIRPEHLHVPTEATAEKECFVQGTIDLVEMLGPESILHLDTGKQMIRARVPSSCNYSSGSSVCFSFQVSDALFFDGVHFNRLF